MAGLCLCASSVLFTGQLMAQPNASQAVHAQQETIPGTQDQYHAFFDVLKENIIKKDKKKVAAVVKYPLFVQLKGKQVSIKNPKQFIRNYNAIITPKIEKIAKEQQFKELISTYRGMAFGNGEIWFAGICQDKTCNDPQKVTLKIIGINNFM